MLLQFLMAADRSNPKVTWLYQWHHPSVLCALDRLIRDCQRNDRPVTACGEMASHPWGALLLLGLGYDHLSLDRASIPLIRWMLRRVDSGPLRRLAQAAMKATSSTEVIELFYTTLSEIGRDADPLARMLWASIERLRRNTPW